MFTVTARASFAWASIAACSFSGPASADLPHHVRLQGLVATGEERFAEDGELLNTRFGFDVAIRNGLTFVGMISVATGSTGRVAVFTQSTSGWTRTATITASDKTSGDFFGRAISFRDGLLVVGSNRAAYVYKLVNGVWREQQKIVPPAADGVRAFSTDLKHEAGVLAIGAEGNDTTRDSVYVYEQDATGKFVRRARIRAADGSLRDGFGMSIGMTNAIIVVGAPGGEAAYILARNSSGNWAQRQKLVPPSEPFLSFGTAVAVDRGMILVGAPGADVPGEDPNSVEGAVFGFLPGATRYVESFRLYPDPDSVPDSLGYWSFGSTIAMFDKRIAIGGLEAPTNDLPWAIVSTYSRDGSSVLPLGHIRDGRAVSTGMAIANNLLLIGSSRDGSLICALYGICGGSAALLHLNQFE
jgi:hypothetical protein